MQRIMALGNLRLRVDLVEHVQVTPDGLLQITGIHSTRHNRLLEQVQAMAKQHETLHCFGCHLPELALVQAVFEDVP